METMANEMRGEIRIDVDGTQHTVKFNMYTIYRMCKNAGRSLAEIEDWFKTDHLDAIIHAVFAGLQNAAISSDKEWPHSFERTGAMLGDVLMDEVEITRIADAMAAALAGKQKPGNTPAATEAPAQVSP